MACSKLLSKTQMLAMHRPQPKIVQSACHFHRLSIAKKLVSQTPNRFLTTELRHLTATNFTSVRHSSEDSKTSESSSVVDDVIPEAPEVPIEAAIADPAEIVLNILGEQTLQSAGLGSWTTPVGLLQSGLEFLHVSCGLPWWGAIIAGKL